MHADNFIICFISASYRCHYSKPVFTNCIMFIIDDGADDIINVKSHN